jgi:FkbM family methyltransferase
MNKEEQVKYYLSHREEFFGDARYFNFMEKLGKKVQPVDKLAITIDVGACIGEEFHIAESFLKGKENIMLAFEPNPMNYNILEGLKSKYKHLFVIRKAVSNEEKESIPFYTLQEFPDNKSGYGLAGIRAGGQVICNTEMTTLDKELTMFDNLDYQIQLLKIDVEGNDTMVLEGCKNHLHRVNYIIFEASDCLDDKRGPGIAKPLETCIKMLDEKGFDVYRVGTRRLLKLNQPYWDDTYEKVKYWSDCFACKKNDPIVKQVIDSKGFIV